jgi:hypothetical protein
MNKKIIVVVVLAVLLLLAAGYRLLQVLPYPMGGGMCKESPDKRFTAHASSLTDLHYFGGVRCYYEFTIESAQRQRIRCIVIDEPPDGMIGWREEGEIQWAADSSSVTYTFKGTRLIMSVTP